MILGGGSPGPKGDNGWVVLVALDRRDNEVRVIPGPKGGVPTISESEHCIAVLGGDLDPTTIPGLSDGSSTVALLGQAYLHHGDAFFSRLRGSFAFILCDRRSRTLLAVRDPMGTHPLFYAAFGPMFAASPSAEAAAVAAREGRELLVDVAAATAYVLGASLPAERTLYSDVKRLPQGHQLARSNQTSRVSRYWHPAPPEHGARPASGDYSVAQFQAVLNRAVDRNLAAGQAGVYLSGGLDSASVAAALVEVSRGRGDPAPLALLALLRGTDADEESTQRTVADALSLRQLARTPDELLGDQGLLRSALDLARTTPGGPPQLVEPLYDALALLAKEHGCETVLSGIGGDDWLLPPQIYPADRLRRLDIPAVVDFARAWLGYWPELDRRETAQAVLWTFGLQPILRNPVTRSARHFAPEAMLRRRSRRITTSVPEWIAPDPSVRHSLAAALIEGTQPPARIGDLMGESKRRLLDHVTPSLMLETTFAAAGRTGVRVLAPLLDPDVVAFLYTAPSRRLVANGRAKAPAAELVEQKVPQLAGSWPRTVYGDSIWGRSLASDGGAAWSEIEGTPLLAELGIVDLRLLAERLQPSVQGRPTNEPFRIVRALILDIWLRSRIVASSTRGYQ